MYGKTRWAYLVLSVESTTAVDLGGRASLLVLDGESVLADGRPPDVGQSAGTLAVDTLDLVGSNDDVGDAAALLDLEDSVGVATLGLASALNATVDGQTTAHYIADVLAGSGVAITSLAQGVPIGGELDYLDDGTIGAAMRARKRF